MLKYIGQDLLLAQKIANAELAMLQKQCEGQDGTLFSTAFPSKPLFAVKLEAEKTLDQVSNQFDNWIMDCFLE